MPTKGHHLIPNERALWNAMTPLTTFQSHSTRIDNPHQVTQHQVGLGNVNNTSDMDKPISNAVQGVLDSMGSGMTSHVSNFNNPHVVTKDQIGLGNADNTSDANKPISTATQNALNQLIGLPTWDGSNYIIKFTTVAGTTFSIDLPIESLAKGISYNAPTKEIVLIKQDNSEIRINVTDLVDIYVGTTSAHIQITVVNNVIMATLLGGSVTENELAANLAAKINAKAEQVDLVAHTSRVDNPHTVTTAQIGAVSYSASQSLGSTQRSTARNNIQAVSYEPQNLFPSTEQAIARDNISAQKKLDRLLSTDDNAIGTISDTGTVDTLYIPVPVTIIVGNDTVSWQMSAGTYSLRAITQRILDNLANLFTRLGITEVSLATHAADKSNPHEVTTEQINAVNRSGDYMNGILQFHNNVGGIYGTMGTNDYFHIYGREIGGDLGYLEIGTGDNGNEPIHFRQWSYHELGDGSHQNHIVRTATILDESGNTVLPGRLYPAGGVEGYPTNAEFETLRSNFQNQINQLRSDLEYHMDNKGQNGNFPSS
jgi:hypothetical protein